MIHPSIKAFIQNCPTTPGVYIIKDDTGIPIYIGKARSLKSRLACHFGARAQKDPKEYLIGNNASHIEIIQTSHEAEALLLEASLVKQHHPKYNIDLKDDKSYPFIKITDEDYPRLLITRGRKSDGARYYGPFTNVGLLRQAAQMLKRLFPLRTCQPMPDRVCLMFHIGQCPGPCENHVSKEEYRKTVEELVMFLEGKYTTLIKVLTRRMEEASEGNRFEEAMLYRDQIRALGSVAAKKEKQDVASILRELQDKLRLSRYPERIEAFDISNIQGQNPVASLVVFEGAKPKKSDYRKFKIKTVEGINDYEMMREVVRRHYTRVLAEKRRLPDLIVIDGGKGHLSSAKEELEALNLGDVDCISIAKEHEYLFKPDRETPYVLPMNSPVLKMIRHLRDEAHRFAITFYRKLHRKKLAETELDGIPGIGPRKKAILLKAFKSVQVIKQTPLEQLAQIPGIDYKTAQNIALHFKNH